MKLIHIAPDELQLSPELNRSGSAKSFEDRLRASIDEIGLAEPLKVARQPDGRYLVIDGNLRLRAVRSIRKEDSRRFVTIPAYVLDYDKRYEIRYQSDIYQDLLPSQLATLVEHLHNAENVLKVDIARYIGVSPATLRNYTGLWRLMERGGLFAKVVELMDVGVFPASNPYAWLRLTDKGLRQVLIERFSNGERVSTWIDDMAAAARLNNAQGYPIKYIELVTSALPAKCYRHGEDLRAIKRGLGLRRAAMTNSVKPDFGQAIKHLSKVSKSSSPGTALGCQIIPGVSRMKPSNWLTDAFFEMPARGSVDGGTTSAGDLWHSVSPRWGHAMHSMCSYHGMFPAKVAHYFIQRYSMPGDLVLDPFSGRGTTPLQARVENRRTICNDLNPLAYVLSHAKSDPPSWESAISFLDGLEVAYRGTSHTNPDVPDDIRMLYHDNTLKQICFVRKRLLTKVITEWSREELMIGGALAGIMHGAWRRDETSQYLSISMPNTFSMSPAYVDKFIRENGLKKIDQDVFDRLRNKLARLYLDDIRGPIGNAHYSDASKLLKGRTLKPGSVDLIITSPPYLQVVNYGTSNWIRLWLLGVDGAGRDHGEGRKHLNAALDHRHTYDSYCEFMLRTMLGMQRVLKRDGVAIVVVGDVKDPEKEKPLSLAAQMWEDIRSRTELRLLEIVEDELPVQNKVSRIWGDTKGQATSRDCALVLARAEGKPDLSRVEVEWDEPYKDGGADAAHERLRQLRNAA